MTISEMTSIEFFSHNPLIQELINQVQDRNGYTIEGPSNPRYDQDLIKLHELGHHALFPVWGLDWALTLHRHQQERRQSRSLAPWIPCLELPFEGLPDEQSVKLWTAIKAQSIGFPPEWNLEKAAVLNDHASSATADPTLMALPRFGIQPSEALAQWCDEDLFCKADDFSLPYPRALRPRLIIQNWEAIAERFADRCPAGTLAWLQQLPNSWHNLLKAQF